MTVFYYEHLPVYHATSGGELYHAQLEDLLGAPEVTVRGLKTRELLNVVTIIDDPTTRIQVVPGRRLNPWLAISEALWLLAGRRDVAALAPYNKRIGQFSDDGETLYGAYGYRLREQIGPLIARLQNDPHDRAAVLGIWMPKDLTADSKDKPCNDMLMFKLRDGKLNMSVFCRSNDLHWGLQAVNIIQFSILQEYIAARLGCELGHQMHWSDSLHIYTDPAYMSGASVRISGQMIDAGGDFVPLKGDAIFPHLQLSHQEFVFACNDVLDYDRPNHRSEQEPFLAFAEDFLRWYRENKRSEIIRYEHWFPSWMKAAKHFTKAIPEPTAR